MIVILKGIKDKFISGDSVLERFNSYERAVKPERHTVMRVDSNEFTRYKLPVLTNIRHHVCSAVEYVSSRNKVKGIFVHVAFVLDSVDDFTIPNEMNWENFS